MKIKNYLFAIITFAHLLINTSFGQAPQSFNYQAVARDASGLVLGNQAVNFRISLLQGSATGASAYTETHAVTTNLLGLVNFAIGGGTVISGNFATINWAQGPFFAQVELDAANNGTYVVMSTTQLLSVPYAQYAEKSGNPTLHAGSGIAIQNDSIVNTAQNQQVNVSGTGQTNITGTYPNYVVNTPNIQAGNGISVTGQIVTNTAPDQTVILNGTGQSSVTGTYPSFTVITPNMVAGNGISLSGQTITNTAPDQTVTINGTGHTTVTGTYPNFTVNTPNYVGGTGITISGNNIAAQNTNSIWNANKLQGKDIDTLTPTLGKVLQFDGSKWKPSDKLPQMTTAQREALTNLYAGMTILNTNTDCIEYYTGIEWLATCGSAGDVGTSEFGGVAPKGALAIRAAMPDSTLQYILLFNLNNCLYFEARILIGNIYTPYQYWKFNTNTNLWSQIPVPPSGAILTTGYSNLFFSMGNIGYIITNTDIYKYNSTTNLWNSTSLNIGTSVSTFTVLMFNDSVNAYFTNLLASNCCVNTIVKYNSTNDSLTLISQTSPLYGEFPGIYFNQKFYFIKRPWGDGSPMYYGSINTFDKNTYQIDEISDNYVGLLKQYLFKYKNKLYDAIYDNGSSGSNPNPIYNYIFQSGIHKNTGVYFPKASGLTSYYNNRPIECNGKLYMYISQITTSGNGRKGIYQFYLE